jgi:DNA-directed RNA polymerase specialized sigma24 family protein
MPNPTGPGRLSNGFGKDHAEAEDITQGFFERILSRRAFQHLEPAKTRLRSFLWVALRHYLVDVHDHQHCQKRAGDFRALSLDALSASQRYQCDPVDRWTPEQLFARRWALALIDAALARLQRGSRPYKDGQTYVELVDDPAEVEDKLNHLLRVLGQ